MSFSQIVYMICVNGGYFVSEMFNTIDRKTWWEIKETLQWPPMENQLVVYTQIVDFYAHISDECRRRLATTIYIHRLFHLADSPSGVVSPHCTTPTVVSREMSRVVTTVPRPTNHTSLAR